MGGKEGGGNYVRGVRRRVRGREVGREVRKMEGRGKRRKKGVGKEGEELGR